MRKFRYDLSGKWFKGNTHIHSFASDGGLDFKALADLYSGAGYDFLFRTDHWVSSDIKNDSEQYPLLWCDGVELDGCDSSGAAYHVVALGKFEGISRENGFEAGMKSAKEQGAFLILAHPFWMGNSMEDAMRWPFDGVEIYNHVCRQLNGKGDGRIFWEHMLKNNLDIMAFGADDSHLEGVHSGWNGGWVFVNIPELSEANII
jgi:predicted metal-dependent phosphoesterase TrpH